MNHDMERFSVRATAKKIHKRHIAFKIMLVILLLSVSLLAVGFGLSMLVTNVGNFTVVVPDDDMGMLSLCNTPDFANATSVISAEAVPSMDNITISWLPEDIDQVDGSHNGDNYIAHTFYLKNMGEDAVDYSAKIKLETSTLGADEAVRVMVIKNGDATVYAKPAKGSGEPEPDTTPFYSSTLIMNEENRSFDTGAVDKYTVVIWLEGNDPECVDNIRGGVVKMSMDFSVIDDTAFT